MRDQALNIGVGIKQVLEIVFAVIGAKGQVGVAPLPRTILSLGFVVWVLLFSL